jgi:queuine tRNA-ribosyltransferase subunit QTRTD1
MDEHIADGLSRLPPEMLAFTLKQAASGSLGPRVGQLLRSGRTAINTPHYIATTSRGVIPHVSSDVLAKSTAVSAVYYPLEDCKSARAQA